MGTGEVGKKAPCRTGGGGEGGSDLLVLREERDMYESIFTGRHVE